MTPYYPDEHELTEEVVEKALVQTMQMVDRMPGGYNE